jgi:hypothetical protein
MYLNKFIKAAKLTAQQLTYLPLLVVQGGLVLPAWIGIVIVAPQSPPQAMSTAMAWMI